MGYALISKTKKVNVMSKMYIKAIRDRLIKIIETQKRFERVYGGGQHESHLKNILKNTDVIKTCLTSKEKGEYATIRIALRKAKSAACLEKIVKKIDSLIAQPDFDE